MVHDLSQKEQIFYDRREWSVSILLACIVIMAFFAFIGLGAMPQVARSPRTPDIGITLRILVFIGGSVYIFAYLGSTRTIINGYGIKLQHTFSRKIQMFYYNDIAKIVFGDLGSNYTKNPESRFKPDKFAATFSGVRFTIFLSNGEYYYIWTEYEHEITRALEKITPRLIIERNT